jgi:hypothetical protein
MPAGDRYMSSASQNVSECLPGLSASSERILHDVIIKFDRDKAVLTIMWEALMQLMLDH